MNGWINLRETRLTCPAHIPIFLITLKNGGFKQRVLCLKLLYTSRCQYPDVKWDVKLKCLQCIQEIKELSSPFQYFQRGLYVQHVLYIVLSYMSKQECRPSGLFTHQSRGHHHRTCLSGHSIHLAFCHAHTQTHSRVSVRGSSLVVSFLFRHAPLNPIPGLIQGCKSKTE